jgi:hypothetical protein
VAALALIRRAKVAALRCFGDIRHETMEREGLIGSSKGTRIMDGFFVERWGSRKKTKKLAANKTCAYCGEAFYAERSMQVFCSNLCDKKVDKRGRRIESVSHRLRSANLQPESSKRMMVNLLQAGSWHRPTQPQSPVPNGVSADQYQSLTSTIGHSQPIHDSHGAGWEPSPMVSRRP